MANVTTQVDTTKLSERQQSLLRLAQQMLQSITPLTGEATMRITIEVPAENYEEWMIPTIKDSNIYVVIQDDSLPF